ncbi:MAG: hypothetical protein PHG59_02380 [Patescibacteria group bacterium]|nr:hypothetical protein [Patescibacteria group bacterium]
MGSDLLEDPKTGQNRAKLKKSSGNALLERLSGGRILGSDPIDVDPIDVGVNSSFASANWRTAN